MGHPVHILLLLQQINNGDIKHCTGCLV